jgi:predicted O-methyltransferase YrrM
VRLSNFLHQIKWFLNYSLKAQNLHGVHSPFVYAFNKQILNATDATFYPFEKIEALRNQLLKSNESVLVTDFGAGSRLNQTQTRKVAKIAKYSLKPQKIAALYFRIIQHYQYQNLLELGTSLGITSAYLASAAPKGNLSTLEGCPNIAQIAHSNFKKLNLFSVEPIVGAFEVTLQNHLASLAKPIDFVLIDGNHRYKPTINYLNQIIPYLSDNACVIIDDIYWSSEMTKAWEEAKKNPTFTVSINLFSVGILFKHAGKIKEDFVLRFPYF